MQYSSSHLPCASAPASLQKLMLAEQKQGMVWKTLAMTQSGRALLLRVDEKQLPGSEMAIADLAVRMGAAEPQ